MYAMYATCMQCCWHGKMTKHSVMHPELKLLIANVWLSHISWKAMMYLWSWNQKL